MKKIASKLADKLHIKDFANEESFRKAIKTILTGYSVVVKYYSKEHLLGEITITIDDTILEVWVLQCHLNGDTVQVQYQLIIAKSKN
jgi:hypothetical protein